MASQAVSRRRRQGRLRKLTDAERERRAERRERVNPAREAHKRAMRGRTIYTPKRKRRLATDWSRASQRAMGRP